MSCVFVIVPIVAGSWTAICSVAGVAAGVLGYKKLSQAALEKGKEEEESREKIELEDKYSNLLFSEMQAEEELCFEKEGIRILVTRNYRGHLKIKVYGEGKTKQELQKEAERFLNLVRRQFVYQKVMEEMKNKGFQVVKEEVEESGRIKIRLRRIG